MGGEPVYLVVGVVEGGSDEENTSLVNELLEYDKQAQAHTGCLVSSVSNDLVRKRSFRIMQEWKSRENFLAFQRLVPPPAGTSLTHYKGSLFSAPGLAKAPHHGWAKAERKDLTKTQGKLFFLSIEGRTNHAIFNNTSNLQYDVTMRFPGQNMVPAPGTIQTGDQYTLSVFPGETQPFITGKWNGGYALSYSYGPVTDTKYLDETAKAMQQKVKSETEDFIQFLKSKGLNPDQPGVIEDAEFEEKAAALTLAEAGRKYVDLKWQPVQTSVARPFEGKRRVLAWMRPEDYLPPELRTKVDHVINQIEPGMFQFQLFPQRESP